MLKVIEWMNTIVWGAPALVLILGVGIRLTGCTGFAQIRLLPKAVRRFFSNMFAGRNDEGISPFRALCTALGATVGTGNIAGVAGAIAIGGPGAVFWMWISAFVGMITKFAEVALAVRYRKVDANGNYVGGPMYMIRYGMGVRWQWLASAYCFFGVVAALGIGNATQIDAVITGINMAAETFGYSVPQTVVLLLAAIIAGVLVCALLGGAKRVGLVAELLVPFASVAYLLLGLGVLIARVEMLPQAFVSILTGAFTPGAVTGGAIGSMTIALRVGVSRGVFTNEAGMGTASIAHASASGVHPVEQGMMGIVEVFLDTIVICTMTALVILCSGVPIGYGIDVGAALTTEAFAGIYGQWVCVVIALLLCCFAFATMLGWGLYGVRCAQYLFGNRSIKSMAIMQGVIVVLSTLLSSGTVWMLAEIVNGLMAIPNLIALAVLSPELVRILRDYQRNRRIDTAIGGTYENFDQCKQMRAVTYAQVSSSCGGCQAKGKEDISPEHRSA